MAEPPAAEPQPPAAPPPDLVRLKDGGLLRGTIAELVPERRVVIVLITGEKRTVPMHLVEYAGPATKEPAPAPRGAPPPPPPETSSPSPSVPPKTYGPPSIPGMPRLKLTADEPDLTFYVRTDSSSGPIWTSQGVGVITIDTYRRLCTAPCETQLKAGTYAFGVSRGDGRPVPADEAVRVDSAQTLAGEYESYAGMRTAGWIIAGVGLIGGIALILTSTSTNDCDIADPDCEPGEIDSGRMFGGLAVVGVTSLVGFLMAFKSDEASVTRTTGAAGARRGGERGPSRASTLGVF